MGIFFNSNLIKKTKVHRIIFNFTEINDDELQSCSQLWNDDGMNLKTYYHMNVIEKQFISRKQITHAFTYSLEWLNASWLNTRIIYIQCKNTFVEALLKTKYLFQDNFGFNKYYMKGFIVYFDGKIEIYCEAFYWWDTALSYSSFLDLPSNYFSWNKPSNLLEFTNDVLHIEREILWKTLTKIEKCAICKQIEAPTNDYTDNLLKCGNCLLLYHEYCCDIRDFSEQDEPFKCKNCLLFVSKSCI